MTTIRDLLAKHEPRIDHAGELCECSCGHRVDLLITDDTYDTELYLDHLADVLTRPMTTTDDGDDR